MTMCKFLYAFLIQFCFSAGRWQKSVRNSSVYKFIQLFAYCLFIHAIFSIQVFLFMNNLLGTNSKTDAYFYTNGFNG